MMKSSNDSQISSGSGNNVTQFGICSRKGMTIVKYLHHIERWNMIMIFSYFTIENSNKNSSSWTYFHVKHLISYSAHKYLQMTFLNTMISYAQYLMMLCFCWILENLCKLLNWNEVQNMLKPNFNFVLKQFTWKVQ